MHLMPLTPPTANRKTTTIPTIACLVTTTSLTPLPTTTVDATTSILTVCCLMTTEINYKMPPLKTSLYATNSILSRSLLAMKIMTHPMPSTIATTTIITMITTNSCQTTSTIIPHENWHYHDHYISHHAPNYDDDNNGRTYGIYDDDKENSGNNDYRYEDLISGHHRGKSKDGSNVLPDVSVPSPHSPPFLPYRNFLQYLSRDQSVPSPYTRIPTPQSPPFLPHRSWPHRQQNHHHFEKSLLRLLPDLLGK